MGKAIDCKTLSRLRDWSEDDKSYFTSKMEAAIGNLIGFIDPSSLLGINEKNVKAMDEEEKRMFYMNEIYNMLHGHLEHLGKVSYYNPASIDTYLNMIRGKFAADFTEPLMDLNNFHWRRGLSLKRKLERMIKQSSKGYIPSGTPLTWWEKNLWEPANLVYSRDKTGRFAKIIQMVKRSSDIIQGRTREYSTRHSNIMSGLAEYFNDHIWENRDNLNSAVFGGLEGIDKPFTTNTGREVIIHGEGTGSQSHQYQVSYPPQEGMQEGTTKLKWLDKDKVNVTQDQLKASSRKAFQVFYQDLLDGRVRYVRTAHIPSDFIENQNWRESTNEGLFISKVLDEISAQRKAAKENNMTFTPKHRDYHTTTDKKGTQYSFVYVKDEAGERGEEGDGSAIPGENYNAYLVQIREAGEEGAVWNFFESGTNSTDEFTPSFHAEDSEGNPINQLEYILPEGFYEAGKSMRFKTGKIIGVAEGIEEDGSKGFIYDFDRQRSAYHSFSRMIHQPGSGVLKPYGEEATAPGITPRRRFGDVVEEVPGLWNAIRDTRTLYKDFFKYVQKEVGDLSNDISVYSERIREKVYAEMGDISELSEEEKSFKINEAEERINETLTIGGWKSDIKMTEDGRISIGAFRSDGLTNPKAMNYDPAQYYDGEYEQMADEALATWQRQVEILEEALGDIEPENRSLVKGQISEIQERITVMNETLSRLADVEVDNEGSRIMNTPSHLRSISSMMNRMNRKREANIAGKYFERTVTSLHQTRIKAEFLKALSERSQNPELYDYMINQAKIAFGDVDYDALFSHQKTADFFNKFSSKKGWKPTDVEHMVVMANLMTTSHLLGMYAAMHNNTQRLNPIMLFGLKRFWRSREAVKDKNPERPKWEARVENSGVLVLVNAFHEIMLGESGTSVGWGNLPIIELAKIASISAMDRKSFIQGGDSKVDKFLKMLNSDERMNITRLKELRGVWYDLITNKGIDKNTSKREARDLTEARIKKLKRKWKRLEARKAALWKLKFWPLPGEKFLTFTGVERAMRLETGVMMLQVAEEMGAIRTKGNIQVDIPGQGRVDDDAKWYDDDAVDMVRTAVYNTQFGMSQQFLPHIFGGAGKFLFQYKTYPYNQSRHDWKIVKNFLDGNEGESALSRATDGTRRLMDLTWESARKIGKGLQETELKDEERDALRIMRFLLSRVLVSAIAVSTSMLPIIGDVWRGGIGTASTILGGNPTTNMRFFRAAENPVVGLMMRTLFLGLAFGGEDDGEDEWFKYVRRFILPPFISVLTETMASMLDD